MSETNGKNKTPVINLPTKITIARLILVPICMIFILYPIIGNEAGWRITAAAIFLFTSLTDFLDGMLARKLNLVTDLGKLLDPLADKLLIAGALLALIVRGLGDGEPVLLIQLEIWSLFIIFTRELAVTLLRSVAMKNGTVIAAAWLGKVKTTLQMIAVCAILLEPLLPFETAHALSYITVTAMCVMTVWSGADYFRAWALSGKEKNDNSENAIEPTYTEANK